MLPEVTRGPGPGHPQRTKAVGMLFRKNVEMVNEADALPGRTDQTMPVPEAHFVNGNPLVGPWPEGMRTAAFAMGCFWGVERKFWQLDGVWSTFVGYAGLGRDPLRGP